MNNNIEETYCSFEVSSLLKDKGFGVPCINYYHKAKVPFITTGVEYDSDRDCVVDWNTLVPYPNKEEEVLCSAPTHSLVVEWLRVNFGIHLFLDYNYYDGFHYGYRWVKYNGDYGEYWKDNDHEHSGWDSPQEATEAALLYTLKNLI